MPDVNPAPPLHVPVVPGVNGAPLVAGNKLGEPDLPFSAATNTAWEAAALEKAQTVTNRRTLHVLNGRRVTAWRICVEKKRKEWATIFGVAPGSLAELPPDCKGKILEFMAPVVSSSGARVTPADLRRIADRREAEIVDKWVDLILEFFEEVAAEKGWDVTTFYDNFLNEENAGDTLEVLLEDEHWWEFKPFLNKLKSLGFKVTQIGDTDPPYVLAIGVPA